MRRRRRRGSAEINMTPLLDVLFCILFIVMLTSAQNEAKLRESRDQEAAEYSQSLSEKDAELARVRENATAYKTLAESLRISKANALVASLRNETLGGRHTLIITKETGESTNIPLGSDNLANALSRLEASIDPLLTEANGSPLYLIFTCDRTQIYTDEFNALNNRLTKYQSEHKEIFYKLTEP
ncbi:MAG: biopolymer transporter ExbD [Lachnospiraceae bacterium]